MKVFYCNKCETGNCLRLVPVGEMLTTSCLLRQIDLVGFEQTESVKCDWQEIKKFKMRFKETLKNKACDCCGEPISIASVFCSVRFRLDGKKVFNIHIGCLSRLANGYFDGARPNLKKVSSLLKTEDKKEDC